MSSSPHGSAVAGVPRHFDRVTVNQFDPAGPSPGGIDTCLRGICEYADPSIPWAIVDVDTGGGPATRTLGPWELHQFGERMVWSMPVARLDLRDQRRRIPHALMLVLGALRDARRNPRSDWMQADRMGSALALRPLLRRPLAYFVHTQENGRTGGSSDKGPARGGTRGLALGATRRVAREAGSGLERRARRDCSSVESTRAVLPHVVRPQAHLTVEGERAACRILWAGRLETPKRPNLAIDTLVQLPKATSHSAWRLDVIGSGFVALDEGLRQHYDWAVEQFG